MKYSQFRTHRDLVDELVQDGWQSPDTYSNHFAGIPDRPAIYLLLAVESTMLDQSLVGYVGMSTSLSQRLSGHQVIDKIAAAGYWPMRWFRPTSLKNLRAIEAQYITKFDPPWNVIGRPRGIILQ